MNEFEKAAVSILKKPIVQVGPPALEAPFRLNDISERMAKRRKRDEETRNYIDCNFFLGSVARWSECLALRSMFSLLTGVA